MKALCTCAALAVATAFAHGSLADGIAQDKDALQPFRSNATTLNKIADDQHCTVEVNKWRKEVDPSALEYQPNASGNPSQDLQNFFTTNNCDVLKAGSFTHIHQGASTKAFVFSATRPAARRNAMTCTEAVEEWKKGFEAFSGEYPAKFTQGDGAYADPNAVGLVALLDKAAQKIYCGTPDVCDAGTLICYINPSVIQEQQHPVAPDMWHKVEEKFSLKPTVAPHDDGQQEFLNAVNAVREAEGLNLPKFTAPTGRQRLRLTKSVVTPSYEKAMYNVTCDEIEKSTISPKIEEEYTLIYAVKDGEKPPTPAEAVEFWKTGYAELGPDVPPAFKSKEDLRAEANEGEIYYNNAVAGFVSLMVDATREVRCYNATGCTKAALICFLAGPTLVEDQKPISDKTWQKILTLETDENHDKSMTFTKLVEAENCLTEINEFRTQDSLGLKAFVAKASTSTDSGAVAASKRDTELEMFTCDALKSGNAPFLFTATKRSVMYYSGSKTCADAVTEWKKGYEKFKDLTVPPTYTSSETMYKTGAATNFISLVSEGQETAATCYTVEGCSEPGLVCVLEPAVFEDGKSPITEATWQKVTTTFSNGASACSVYGALLSTVLVAIGLFALNF